METNRHFSQRLPKGERRVRFADSMGMELVSIFLFDLISNYYFASIHNHQSFINQKLSSTRQQLTQAPSHNTHKTNIKQKQQPITCYPLPPPQTPQAPIIQKPLIQQQQQVKQPQPESQQHLPTHHPQQHQHQQQQQLQLQHQDQQPSYVCEFIQPVSLVSFRERVKLNKVHLETCSVNSRAGNISISCTIRVLNQSYDKSVIVRYTTDEWHTHTDTLASYVPGSCDGWSDKFTSTFSVTNQVKQFQTGQRIIFAIRIIYDGDKVFWDNNGGLNYTLMKK